MFNKFIACAVLALTPVLGLANAADTAPAAELPASASAPRCEPRFLRDVIYEAAYGRTHWAGSDTPLSPEVIAQCRALRAQQQAERKAVAPSPAGEATKPAR
jgi:hypothetical protein